MCEMCQYTQTGKTLEERAQAWLSGNQNIEVKTGDVQKSRHDPVNPAHYAALDPQPWDIVNAWGLDYFEGSVLKYLSRWRRKNGLQDLYKARQFLDKLIAIEEAKE